MNLAQAVASNDLALVRELCRNGHDPNETFACSPRQSSYAVQPIMGHAQNFEPDDILYTATLLNLAVLNGNEDIVRVLIDAGGDLNKKDGRGRTPLLCAVYGLDTLTITPANLALISQTSPAHLSILRNCILPHPSITLSTLNAPQDEIKGITPLCLASYLGKEVVVKCLLEAGKVDVDATDRKGATALMYAARDRHMSVVKILLDHDASPDLTDSNGWSSIQYGQMYPEIVQMFEAALRCRRPEVMPLLTPPESPLHQTNVSSLDRSADGSSNAVLPHALSQSLVQYPLYYSKLSSLLSSHPVTQTSSSSVDSASLQQIHRATHSELLDAIRLGDYMLLQSLLIPPPIENNSNNTGSIALVNHHDPQTGLTPLHHALKARPLPSMEIIKVLYQAGADMNAQSHYGRTALHHLCRVNLEQALTPFNEDGAAPEIQVAVQSNTPTSVPTNGTAPPDDSKSARRYNRYRTDTNGSTGSNHLTPNGREVPGSSAASTTSSNDLSTAPRNNQAHLADCCRLLLRLGSLVNIQDRHNNTPLHFAVEHGGIVEVVRVLVEHGADIEHRNCRGLKPLDGVRGEQSEEIRRILENGRSGAAGETNENRSTSVNALVPSNQPRDSILKPLNLPETLHEVDFQFNQVLQNLEHYRNHTSVSIETSLQYITDQILLGWSPEIQGANGHGQSQEEYNADLVASLGNLKYELESTYELLMITEEQSRDVITFYESELDDMTRQNLTVLTAYDSEKSKVSGLYSIYTRLTEQLEELEAENEGLKMELEEKKRRGLISLGRLVHGAMGGDWSGSRNGTNITLSKRNRDAARRLNDYLTTGALDEESISTNSDLRSFTPPSMVLASQGALSLAITPTTLNPIPEDEVSSPEERDHLIPRPTSPSQSVLSSEGEPALHSIAVLSQKVSLLEQELSSKTCDIKERDLLVTELTDLIEYQSKAFQEEIKSREERIESITSIIGRADEGEQVQTLVDELAVKVMVEEEEKTKKQRIQSGIPRPGSRSISAQNSGDWSFLLKNSSASKGTSSEQGGEDIVVTLKRELEQSKTQVARLELANTTLHDRWKQAIKELEEIRASEVANSSKQNASTESAENGLDSDSQTTLIKLSKIFISTRPRNPQDEPLVLSLNESGEPQEEPTTLEEIELLFEILMSNLAEISQDTEEAESRLLECTRAKEQIYQKCLYLDGLQKKLDENVEKIVSQPFKADTQNNFMQEQLLLQNQLNQLMEQAESVTNLYTKLKKDLEEYKDEKQRRLDELDNVREMMRKIGPLELLRGLLVKLEGTNPDDPAAQRRRETIAAAVAQGMELAAEMAAEEANGPGERVQSHLWRNSCSIIDEGDVQDAIDSRLSTASIDHYTQSCSISDHKLFIQSLCSTLYALQMTTSHQIVSLKSSLSESRASLVLADQELSNLNDQIAGLYDDVGTLRNQLRGLQEELERLIQHRKLEVEKVWEIVGEVRINGNDVDRGMDDDDEGSVASDKSSIKSRALATSQRYSTALGTSMINASEMGMESAIGYPSGTEGSNAGGNRHSVARSVSISRAERASVLRRISSPAPLSENDEGSFTPSRTSHDFSDTSELDRYALTTAEMERLRSVHLHLLTTLTEYKKQISVVKDRNLKLVATLLDRERVRLWTADGQDEVISTIVGQSNNQNNNSTSTSVGAVSLGDNSANLNVGANGGINPGGSSSNLAPGIAAGAKKHHHLSLTAAEDGIKLLRCQLERIRQCEMTRFTEMGAGLTMNYAGQYPPIQALLEQDSLFQR
ncbi:hypothetical protein BGZ76_011537 [Entomortierella beljakovae]|nr:hypothetical protein BGZ76_011537 [Entomortierella beljakovae]